MYQKSCLIHSVERKDNISDKKFPLYNRTHEEIQKIAFIFLLNDSYSYNIC